MPPIDLATSRDNLKLERDAVAMYDALAGIERDPRRREAFERIAANERRHAEIWATKLTELGAEVPSAPRGPRPRVRVIIVLARLFGTRAVADLVKALEGDEEELYESFQATAPEVAAIAEDEREHARIWDRLQTADPDPARAGSIEVSVASVARSVAEINQREAWHRAGGRSGTLRAVIFGVSDGLVSNLALVMGVAGAAADQGSIVLLTGIAGLLAGSLSMAAGEYISMQSQRELFERQIALEKAEMEAMPEEEQAELAAVFRAKGFTGPEAARIAERLFEQPDMALDMLVREELGLDPDELGSPWGAAFGSFAAFAVGAAIPVIPFLFGSGTSVVVISLVASLVALFVVGAGVSLLTGRGVLFSGFRQLGIGLGAAVVTYVIGSLIGVTVAG
ncbi:MAG: VIT1/CCC1 transporter family protein [Chloroflexota bacterium]